MIVFDPNSAYPSDEHGGCYQEVEGDIVKISNIQLSDGQVKVTIATNEHGIISGYAELPMIDALRIGKYVKMRVYSVGGGWYPDNRVISCSNRSVMPKNQNTVTVPSWLLKEINDAKNK